MRERLTPCDPSAGLVKTMSNAPDNLRYTKEHEWLKIEGEEVLIGITDHAQDALTDIVYIELPEEGETYGEMEEFAMVESVKRASPIFAPLAGSITAVNVELDDAHRDNFCKTIHSMIFDEIISFFVTL